jgi:hypothetical protein
MKIITVTKVTIDSDEDDLTVENFHFTDRKQAEAFQTKTLNEYNGLWLDYYFEAKPEPKETTVRITEAEFDPNP